jgi:broad specificity phosphatase PhoE
VPVELLLIRHGQSTWNAEGRWQGQADPPLSDLGRRQALAAAAAVGSVDGIIASDLARAADTAELIAESIGVGPVEVDARLRERHAGAWQGLARAEIDAGWPGAIDEGQRPEGWEPDDALIGRVVPALVDAAARAGEGSALLVVAHSGIAYALEAASGQHDRGRLPNLGGVRITVDDDRWTVGARVHLLDPTLETTPGLL